MPTIEQTVTQMEQYFKFIQTAQTQLAELRRENYLDDDMYEEERRRLQQDIRLYRNKMRSVLEMFDRYPHRHNRHFDRLSDFHKDGSFEESVFVMTKFPDDKDKSAEAVRLQSIIDTVKAGIQARGYVPRIAQGMAYHRWLFDNVELFLLGCARGVAVVEDRYLPELNPNVALEWGWMTGMGRRVLFLREQHFAHVRADWTGLMNMPFDWNNPEPGIAAALGSFLPKRAQAAAGG